MNTTLLLSALAARWRRFLCRLQEAQRLRRDRRALFAMDARELRDLGLSHAEVAAAWPRASHCA